MRRAITGFTCDEAGHWVARLACGHRQHVRHRPPFQPRPWVLEGQGRDQRIGTPLDCPLCDRTEPPGDLRFLRQMPTFDETDLPQGLRRDHRLGPGRWAMIEIERGTVRFTADTEPVIDRTLGPGDRQAVPPEVPHALVPLGPSRVTVALYAVAEP